MLQWCFAGDVTIMLPDLPYVTKPEQATFNSRGGRYYNSDWDFAIDVPANAIPEDQEVTVKMGACAYGPFDIPDNYHVASGFICIVANKPFLEAVNLTLEHCLVFSDYQEDSSVVLLQMTTLPASLSRLSFGIVSTFIWLSGLCTALMILRSRAAQLSFSWAVHALCFDQDVWSSSQMTWCLWGSWCFRTHVLITMFNIMAAEMWRSVGKEWVWFSLP